MGSSSGINEKHRKAIDEMVAEQEGDHHFVPGVPGSLTISMLNYGPGDVVLHEAKIWKGRLTNPCPSVIHKNTPPVKVHITEGTNNESMGAMVYFGLNLPGGPNVCAWLLAWSVTSKGSLNKIYADTGPMAKYTCIDWNDIKHKLETSSHESHHWDAQTGAEESAYINASDMNPRAYAVFDVTPIN